MQPFDILDRKTSVNRSLLLEASAGTGKTFAIEHLVVRLLLEIDSKQHRPADLQEILAVTFTRAAARELKQRIRTNIERALEYFRVPIGPAPDYLIAYQEGPIPLRQHQRRLEEALSCFDEAQIFTVHGFCAHLLRTYTSNDCSDSLSELPPLAIISEVINHFFRTELDPSLCSPLQLRRLLGHYRGDIQALQQALAQAVMKGLPILREPSYEEYLQHFQTIMARLTHTYQWKSSEVINDYLTCLTTFKNLDGMTAEQWLPAIQQTARLFDQTSWTSKDFDGLLRNGLALARLETKQRGQKIPLSSLCYPKLSEILRTELLPLFIKALDPRRIFAWMAHHVQILVERYLDEEEAGGPDQLLQKVLKACDDPSFLLRAQNRYRIAIVDEFQDTDPLQWQLLYRLFSHAQLVLVGDPKQSIYAFRQADIYTYLSAAQSFPEAERLALSINFRSEAALVEAINALFCEEHSPGLISLPRTGHSLPYRPVFPAPNGPSYPFHDNLGAIHLLLLKTTRGRQRNWPGEELERHILLPYIASEIVRLHTKEGLSLKQIAVLVRDRHQATLTQQILKEWNIPALMQRQRSLAESTALPALVEWLEAMLALSDHSAIKRALGGPLIQWSPEQILTLFESSRPQSIFKQLHELSQTLEEKGFATHFQEFLISSWQENGETILNRLLATDEGTMLYQDLQQLADLLTEHQSLYHCSSDELLALLDDFNTLHLHDDERLRIQQDVTTDAVRILTIHMSKGLEFSVVFALGLTKRTDAHEILMPDHALKPPMLRVMEETEPHYLKHCEEVDAEKVRQAYVAMTRAKHRLYLYGAFPEEGSQLKAGEASPLDLLFGRLGQPAASYQEVYERINNLDGSTVTSFCDQREEFSYQWIDPHAPVAIQSFASPPKPAIQRPPPHPTIPGRNRRAYSFTGLRPDHQQDLPKGSLPTGMPVDEQCGSKTVHSLPVGRETGILIHALLESISLSTLGSAISPEELYPQVKNQLKGHRLQEWYTVIAEILYHAAHAKLPQGFSLKDVDPQNQYRELEFMYQSQEDGRLPIPKGTESFFRGSIDLFIEYLGRYYLIDWKTNWLGPTLEYYGQNHLRDAMHQHGYELQGRIYKDAVKRYLARVDPRPIEECFGGLFFLFVRGMNARQPGFHGIYQMEMK